LASLGVTDAAQRLTVLRAADKLDRLGPEGVRLLLGAGRKDESGDFTKGAGLEPVAADRLLTLLGARRATRCQTLAAIADVLGEGQAGDGLAELLATNAVLDALGLDEDQAQIDPAIVRGLEYYTGAVFEAELLTEVKDEHGHIVRFGSVGGGGRYDDLVSRFKGQPIPATGFSIGVSRLAAALAMAQGALEADGPVVVLPFDADGMADCFAIAADLRAAGIAAEVYLGGSGPKAQLKYADKRNAPAAVILGGDERAAGAVTVKDLKLGLALSALAEGDREAWKARQGEVQQTIKRAAMVDHVRAILARASA
jgi:histidyl-tRNA synthetase